MQDPRHQYCQTCPSYGSLSTEAAASKPDEEPSPKGCQQMQPPRQAGQRILRRCPIPPQEALARIVAAHLKRKGAMMLEAQSLQFEVEHAFSSLSPANFRAPEAGARLVISLLQGLTWRRYAAMVQQARGRLTPSSCQWYQGIRGQGSLCHRDAPPSPIAEPQRCPSRDCFAPFAVVSLEAETSSPQEPHAAAPTSRDAALEHAQVQRQLGAFLERSPVLGDLFCQLMDADKDAAPTIKTRWAERFGVTTRTIENWRERAALLLMASYTGALEKLAGHQALAHEIIVARDFSPAHPLPSTLLPWRELCAQWQLSRQEGQRRYRDGWRWMKQWMQDHGYPEAEALTLPFQENDDAS